MRLVGSMKMYLIDPNISIEHFIKNSQEIDVANFILEQMDMKDIEGGQNLPPKKSSRKRLPYKREEKKTFSKFISACTAKEEGSYVTIQNLYEAYVNWMSEKQVGNPISIYAFGKYLSTIARIRNLKGKASKQYHTIYLDINLKNKDRVLEKDAVGELYKFYKLHFVRDNPPRVKIPLNEIYEVYKNWCRQEGTQPILYNTFSKNTRIIMGASHLEFFGRTKKGRRRWLSGYQFRKPISK